jgi:hypothetical protein
MDQNHQDIYVKITELGEFGINPNQVITIYRKSIIREINIDEVVKVSPNEEAGTINLETFDKISLTVPTYSADGVFNKIE